MRSVGVQQFFHSLKLKNMATIMSAVYGGGPFYAGSPALSTLNTTGFSTVICWSVHVDQAGDLIYNDTAICTKGIYVGDPTWGSQLQAVKSGGSVNRILFSVGSGGTSDYTNIMNLINNGGIGPGSNLYENFSILLAAIPVIDGIDMDDEEYPDQNTIVSFSQMLASIGYKEVTFCPYSDQQFWAGCLAALNGSNPGLVTGYNLQCYSGGEGNLNNVPSWISSVQAVMPPEFNAATFINPGLWCKNGPGCSQGMSAATIEQTFSGWGSIGIIGGFIWLYDDIMKCGNDPASYANAINTGLGG